MAAPTEDRRRISARVGVLQAGVIVCFAALAICFWVLQVVQTDKFVEMANSNYRRTLVLRAPRGVLYDRTGRVLVENRNSFTISIDRESAKNLPRTISVVSELLGLDVAQVTQVVDKHVRSEPIYRPIVIVQDATLLRAVDVFAGLRPGGYLLLNSVRTWTELGLSDVVDRLPTGHARIVGASGIALAHVAALCRMPRCWAGSRP